MTERKGGKPQGTFERQTVRHLTMNVLAGQEIRETINKAIHRATEFRAGKMLAEVTFEFNGVNVAVRRDSDPQLIMRDWSRALSGYIASGVGPYPPVELTEEEKVNDKRIEAENRARRQAEDEKRREQERIHRERVEAKLQGAPGIELADEEAWKMYIDKNTDFYGAGIISYSERWARLMQLEIAQGKSLPEIAHATSHEADIHGITGFMYGAAISTLANTWVHGEELRKWGKTQII